MGRSGGSAALLRLAAQNPATPSGLFGYAGISLLRNSQTRSISAENPNGERAGGAKAVPDKGNAGSDLGTGWEVRPCIDLLRARRSPWPMCRGPGVIQHIWITVSPNAYRDVILRFYWDGESSPSIESPLATSSPTRTGSATR